MIVSTGTVFCILMCVLLWSIILGKGYWWVKLLLVPTCIWFSIAISVSMPTFLGWPTKTELPYKYELFWAKIVNPNLTKGEPGAIFMWVEDLDPTDGYGVFELYRYDKRKPRAYEYPYSKELHKKLQEAQKLLRKGRRVFGDNPKGKGKGKGKGKKGDGKGKDGKRGPGLGDEGDDSVGPKFYVMPETERPRKEQ